MAASELDMALHESVLARRAPLEAQQAEYDAKKRQKHYEEREELMGGGKITKEKLKKILKSDKRLYYTTAELNDKLYLHFGGYSKIENLEGFTGLKLLYIESNAIEYLTGLEHMKELKSLFIQDNCLRKIAPGNIDHLPDLVTMNVSNNFLSKIENLPKQLTTLQASGNQIGHCGLDDVRGALVGSKISVLDLQGNKIKEPEFLEEVLCQMPELKVLYLKGNPFVTAIRNYRKTVIAKIPQLSYLDDRPVFKDDRRCAEAFLRGGLEAEREERKLMKEEERDAHRKQMESFRRMCDEAKRAGRERRDMRKEDKFTDETDPAGTMIKLAA